MDLENILPREISQRKTNIWSHMWNLNKQMKTEKKKRDLVGTGGRLSSSYKSVEHQGDCN